MELKDLLGDAYKDGMTLEDVQAAMKDLKLPEDLSAEVARLKNALSQSNGEAAEYKKKLREKMTEDEAAKEKAAEEQSKMLKELEELRRESTVSKNKAKLIGLGYDDALAEETAEAMADGNLDKVFQNQKAHLEAFEKQIRAEALKETPHPAPGGSGKGLTPEDFKKLSLADKVKFAKEHPEEYKALYGDDNNG